jgi:hypothetical protein
MLDMVDQAETTVLEKMVVCTVAEVAVLVVVVLKEQSVLFGDQVDNTQQEQHNV